MSMLRHLGRGLLWLVVGLITWTSLNWLDGKPPLTFIEFFVLAAIASGVAVGSWAEADE